MNHSNLKALVVLVVFSLMMSCLQACPYHDRLRALQRQQQERLRRLRLQQSRNPLAGYTGQTVRRPAQTGHTGHSRHTGYSPNQYRRPATSSHNVISIPSPTHQRRVFYPKYVNGQGQQVNRNRYYSQSYPAIQNQHVRCGTSRYYCKVGSECVAVSSSIGDVKYRCRLRQASQSESCGVGYKLLEVNGTAISCKDINECDDPELNECEHQCTNAAGTYSCSCNSGYLISRDGHTCQDRDECRRADICDYECNNTAGSYTCVCPDGYTINAQLRCKDIDECLTSPCDDDERCLNTYGSYECYSPTPCPPGYSRDAISGPFGTCSYDDFGNPPTDRPITITYQRFALRNNYKYGSELAKMRFDSAIREAGILRGGHLFSMTKYEDSGILSFKAKNIRGPARLKLVFEFSKQPNYISLVDITFVVSEYDF